jgi:hypothetical protein
MAVETPEEMHLFSEIVNKKELQRHLILTSGTKSNEIV